MPRALDGHRHRYYEGEYGFRHCVVASTWAFEAQGPGSIPGGGAISSKRTPPIGFGRGH